MGIFSGIIAKFTGEKAADLVTSIGDVVDKFVQSPEEKAKAMQEIQAQVNSHIEKMAELQSKELEQALKDNDSARNREIQIATNDKAPKLNKIVTPILAISLIALTFTMFYSVMFKHLGAEKDIVIYVLGVLSAITTQVVSYYFGSSSSSQRKQEQIETMINK